MIVQHLHRIQHQHGYLPEDELRAFAEKTATPLYRLQAVASFFPHFRREPPPKVQVQVCQDVSCQLRGACELRKTLESSTRSADVQVEGVSCLGRCDRAPAVRITHEAVERNYCGAHEVRVRDAIDKTLMGDPPPGDTDVDHAADASRDWQIDVYADGQFDPYSVIREFLKCKLGRGGESEKGAFSAANIIAYLETAGLLGMGGAGGRTYKKWNDVLNADGDIKYVVCNADESEPGTFKDRELLLRTPHLVLEGVILGGLVVGAQRGYIYVRHEYEEQIQALRNEIRHAEQIGACGNDLFDTGIDFPVEVFVSPGGYICGEQTALIEAMEDKRAEPRNRPPELQTNGLWDCPTLLNNVETLAWTPSIVLKDKGQWFADQGRKKFRGMRFFSISGDVQSPGVYEVPIGLTLGELIEDYAGGMRNGEQPKAFALSGPSGGFLPRMLNRDYLAKGFVKELETDKAANAKSKTHFDLLDMQLDIRMSRKMDVMLGAGLIVYAESADMVAAATSASRFFRNESCGKCVPCRIGSQKVTEFLEALVAHDTQATDLFGDECRRVRDLVKDLSEAMNLTAICGLGTVASNPIYTLLQHFSDEIEAYLAKVK